MKNSNLRGLKIIGLLIIIFWALWYLLVFSSDVSNFIQSVFSTRPFAFDSRNLSLVIHSFSTYGITIPWIHTMVFAFITLWSGLTAILFGIAAWAKIRVYPSSDRIVYWAFLLSIAQDMVFILSDEFFIQYDLEGGHMERLGVKIITLIGLILIARMTQPLSDK